MPAATCGHLVAGAPSNVARPSREATSEHDARGLGQHVHVLAEILSYELENGRLACTRAACENDPLTLVVRFLAFTRRHGALILP